MSVYGDIWGYCPALKPTRLGPEFWLALLVFVLTLPSMSEPADIKTYVSIAGLVVAVFLGARVWRKDWLASYNARVQGVVDRYREQVGEADLTHFHPTQLYYLLRSGVSTLKNNKEVHAVFKSLARWGHPINLHLGDPKKTDWLGFFAFCCKEPYDRDTDFAILFFMFENGGKWPYERKDNA